MRGDNANRMTGIYRHQDILTVEEDRIPYPL